LDRRIKERGKIQSSVLSNQRTAENFLEISAKRGPSSRIECRTRKRERATEHS